MATRFYDPWKGENYENHKASASKLLILGESHYGKDAERGDATITLTKQYVSGKMNHRFWTNTMNVVRGHTGSTEKDREAFWHQVAFYNYVQASAGAKPRVAPNDQLFKNSEDAFFSTLDELKPQAILVLSKRLWLKLPGTGPKSRAGEPLEADGETRESWIYNYDGGRALATPINHPSSGFSWPRWHKWVVALKKAAAELSG